ncbi:MAG: carbohydrate ABC transporter permease [Treponema sp.]|jgi:raffinose/stachyose/melibiose transport system permease protein|nr:carbohydrate ABC transporter permease [Treponema sp.]
MKISHAPGWYIKRAGYYLFLTVVALTSIFPVYFSVISSLKRDRDVFLHPFTPSANLVFENYPRAVKTGNIGASFINTVFVTAAAVTITVFVSAMASYIFARFIFRPKKLLHTYFIAGMMVPIQIIIIPMSYNLGQLGLFDSYAVLILLFTAFQIPMSVFIISGFMNGMPVEIEEAAVIDGAGLTGVFLRIVVPLSAAGITSASIFNFINIWNNLLFPLVFIHSRSKQLISISLQAFFAERMSDYGGVMAAIVISILPPIAAYIALQEKVEKGLTAGAVKG